MKSKKAILASNILDFYAYLTFIVLIVLFYILFTAGKTEIVNEIKGEAGYSDTQLVLLNILRTPVPKYDNVAGLVAYSVIAENYQDFDTIVRPLLKDHFEDNFQACAWKLEIKDGEDILHELQSEAFFFYMPDKIEISIPPLDYESNSIDLVLSLEASDNTLGDEFESKCLYK